MRTSTILAFAFGAVLVSSSLSAADHRVLNVWPGTPPGETLQLPAEKAVPSEKGKKVLRIENVSIPTITLYQASQPNGAAILICPGGGYNILAWDLEGTEVAEWLNSIGVTAVILKYRVPRRDARRPQPVPMMDAQRAMRLVRQHAAGWGIDPHRLGIMGFSAGGNLAVMTATNWDRDSYPKIDAADQLSSRPDFMLPIYPAYLGPDDDPKQVKQTLRLTKDTPPAFIVVAHDDKNRDINAARFYIELKKLGVSGELHIFSKGGHGYGLRPSADPVSGWPKLAEQWLRTSGFLHQ